MTVKLPLLALFLAGTQTGADRISESQFWHWLSGKRVGLITNQTGVNEQLKHTAARLRQARDTQLVALFAPEHGLDGAIQAGKEVSDEGQIFSLYGENRAPSPEILSNLDVLVYDIQDIGSRFYTFTSTMNESLKAAAKASVPFVVLDRPNPLGGNEVAGPVMIPELASFVGIPGLPIRYGMTAGELARWLVGEQDLQVDLRVVPMLGWKRSQTFDQTGLPWIAPSPNMPTLETAIIYPGFCLIEGTNLSEGRGTTKPFEWIGAPWMNSARVVARLNALNLKGARFRSQNFEPAFSKFRGEQVSGVQVHVRDRSIFQPVEAALALIAVVREIHPEHFQFKDYFDRLVGNHWVRQDLEQGLPVSQIVAKWQPELKVFKRGREKYLLYQ